MPVTQDSRVQEQLRAKLSRRAFVKGTTAAASALAIAGLAVDHAAGTMAIRPSRFQAEPKPGGELRAGQETNMSSLDPHYSIFGSDRHVLYQLYDTITQFDPQLNVQPGLAESWETPDPTTFVFRLRQGVKFHDGTDWNAEAFKFNIDRVKNAGADSPISADFAPIAAVAVGDAHTATITLSEPMAALPSMLADRWGMVVSPSAVEQYGADFTANPVGAGPFRFVEYIPDDRVVVERFADYWDAGLPYLDRIIWRIIPDPTVRFTNLRTQNIDIMTPVSPQDIASIKDGSEFGYAETLALGFEDVRFNCSRPPFDNLALRQACAWAVDREAILQNVYFGHGQVAKGPLPPTLWAANEQLTGYPRDLTRAREKLVEAGHPDGIEVEWDVPTSGNYQSEAEAMQAQLAEIGIQLRLNLMENVQAKQREVEGTNQAEVLSWSGRADPDLTMYSMFHSTGGYNTMRYSNPRVDELVEQARSLSDPAERKVLYDEAQTIVVDECPRLFLVHRLELVAFLPSVQGFELFADSRTRYKWTWLDA